MSVLVQIFEDAQHDKRVRIFHNADEVEIFPPMSEPGFFGLQKAKYALDARFGIGRENWTTIRTVLQAKGVTFDE